MADGGVSLDAARERRQNRLKQAQANQENLTMFADGAVGGMAGRGEKYETDIQLVIRGVTINWLAQAFNMDHRTVTIRLKECPPLKRKRGGSGLLYDLATAAPYLVTPKFNVEEYIRTMKVEELPTRLQEGFWAAALKRQKWEENAGRLWRTEKVVKLFSETFLMVANDMRMWLDDMETVVTISAEQRKALEDQISALQKKISQSIRRLPKLTAPQTTEMAQTPAPVQPKEEPDDVDADINDVI